MNDRQNHRPTGIQLLRQIGWVAITLLLLKGAYVAVELLYNHTLLEFVGSHYLTEQQVENIELFGRNLAAIGLLLLLLPLMITFARRSARTVRMAVAIIVMMAVPTYFAAYKGQEVLIEHLAAKASAEARHDAYYLNMLRGLLARGDIVSPLYLPARADGDELGFEDKLTLLVMPLALANDRAVIQRMHLEGPAATSRFLREDALRSRFADDWHQYRQLQETVTELWSSYQEVMASVIDGQEQVDLEAAAVLANLYLRAGQAYLGYQHANAAYESGMRRRLSDQNIRVTHQRLTEYFQAPASQKSRKYYHATNEMYGMAIPERSASRWCSPETGVCPGSINRVRQVSREIFREAFLISNNGLPPGLTSEQFLRHRVVAERMAEELKRQKIHVPPAFKGEFIVLADVMGEMAAQEIIAEWNAAWAEVGIGQVPAGLNAEQFLSHEAVMLMLPEEVRGKPLFLDVEGFFREVWAPAVEQRIKETQEQLLPDNSASFEEGRWLEVGTKSVKLMYILPLAMSLSAIFSLLNLISIMLTLFAWAYLATKGLKMPQFAGPIVITCAIMMLPYLIPNTLDSEHAGVSLLVERFKDENGFAGVVVPWIVQAESLTYLMGSGVAGLLPPSLQGQFTDWFGG